MWLPRWLSSKESTCQCRRRGFHPWIGKIPEGGNDNSLQYSCLGNPMERGGWWAIAHGVTKELDTTEGQNNKLCAVLVLSRVQLCDPMDCGPPGSSVHGNSPPNITGVGCHALLQGIFPTQVSNPGLPHCQRILYHLSYQGSPNNKQKYA